MTTPQPTNLSVIASYLRAELRSESLPASVRGTIRRCNGPGLRWTITTTSTDPVALQRETIAHLLGLAFWAADYLGAGASLDDRFAPDIDLPEPVAREVRSFATVQLMPEDVVRQARIPRDRLAEALQVPLATLEERLSGLGLGRQSAA